MSHIVVVHTYAAESRCRMLQSLLLVMPTNPDSDFLAFQKPTVPVFSVNPCTAVAAPAPVGLAAAAAAGVGMAAACC